MHFPLIYRVVPSGSPNGKHHYTCLGFKELLRRGAPSSLLTGADSKCRSVACAESAQLQDGTAVRTKPDDLFPLVDHVSQPDSNTSIWRSTWWPVGRLVELKEDEPNATQLLGMDLVLWKDAKGNWSAARDECPHRSDNYLWKPLKKKALQLKAPFDFVVVHSCTYSRPLSSNFLSLKLLKLHSGRNKSV